MMESPWSTVPRTPPRQIQQQQAMPPQPVTPDMLYPSFPNPAGLGSQVPYPVAPPAIVPAPAYIQQPPQEIMQALNLTNPNHAELPPVPTPPPTSSWGMMRG